VRNLIELSAIESLGKLTRVPYWQCLEIDQASPTYRTEARQWFDALSETDRIRFARSTLAHAGYLADDVGVDAVDAPLQDAIARYQSEHDLVANGRVDFDLYYRLMAEAGGAQVPKLRQSLVGGAAPALNSAATTAFPAPATPVANAPTPIAAPAAATVSSAPTANAPTPLAASAAATVSPAPATSGPTSIAAPDLRLSTDRGDHPSYHIHETLAVEAVTTRDAFLYCYYQDADGTVARIFPNRFQPSALVQGGAPVDIPPGSDHAFDIRFEQGRAKESVACVASNDELGAKLPDQLKGEDLAPLPVTSLQDIVGKLRQLGAGPSTEKWLPIEVM
jgi:hypothetical protein